MNRTMRFATVGLLFVGTSALSFGETFASLDSTDWNATYNSSKALFSAVFQPSGYILQSGFPSAGAATGGGAIAETFTLTYDPTVTPAIATLTVGDDATVTIPALNLAAAGGGLDHIGIALSTGSDDELITISNIMLNGAPAGGSLTGAGQGLVDFAMTPPTDLTGAKSTLTGEIDLSWTGNGTRSDISAEIVGADSVVITPEPGTWALLGSALAGLGFLRRKRFA